MPTAKLLRDDIVIAEWTFDRKKVTGPEMPIKLHPDDRARAKELAESQGIEPEEKDIIEPADGPYFICALVVEHDRSSRVTVEID